jgi:hypothetical protein
MELSSLKQQRFHMKYIMICLGLISRAAADWQYKFRPDLSPPIINITIPPSSLISPGHIFIAPYTSNPFIDGQPYVPIQPAPYIFTSTGELVWSGVGYFSGLAENFQAATYHSQEILFAYEGKWNARPGNGHGHVKILNRKYEMIKEFRSGSNCILDFHEFNVLDGKTALVQSNHPVPYDLGNFVMKPDSQWVMEDSFQGKNFCFT